MTTPNPDSNGLTVVTLGTSLKTEGSWKAFSVPAVSVAPTASQGAGAAGVKNVCLGVHLALAQIAAQASVMYFTLRDGATGAGTIIMQWPVAIGGVNSVFLWDETGLYIPGTAATAMTLELTNQAGVVTNPTATNFASCTMWGNQET